MKAICATASARPARWTVGARGRQSAARQSGRRGRHRNSDVSLPHPLPRGSCVRHTGADCSARLGDRPVLPWWTVHAKQGDVLTIGVPTSGTRCYLSLAGGVDVPVVLGSRSTQLRGQFGGFNGRQLQKGDVVKAVGPPSAAVPQEPAAAGFGTVPPDRCRRRYPCPQPMQAKPWCACCRPRNTSATSRHRWKRSGAMGGK